MKPTQKNLKVNQKQVEAPKTVTESNLQHKPTESQVQKVESQLNSENQNDENPY